MARRFIPPINLPLEGVAHAKWLEDQHILDRTDIDTLLAWMNRSNQEKATLARQTIRTTRDTGVSSGLPDGGTEKQQLAKRTSDDYDAEWVENTLGGMLQDYYDVEADGGGVSLLSEYEPKLFEFNITSPSDNSPYGITLPELFNFPRDLALPFYVLSIYVHSHSVDLEFVGSAPTYVDHPGVYILGAEFVGGPAIVTVPAGFQAQWFVLGNFSDGSARAIPMVDPYHASRFGAALNAGDAPAVATTAAAGTGATASITQGTSLSGVVELVTGTSPTTTGWGELLTFTNGWTDPPVLALYPANQAAAGLTHYGTISGVEAEAWFDLTGIAASTTYLFHYSLLPAVAL